MSQIINLPPGAELFDSMRSMGYTVETALADLLDNSIDANATQIRVFFDSEKGENVVIADNGQGMSKSKLITAMQLSGKSTRSDRNADELGRFGLGLKTASLSQCRKLTVVSKTATEGIVAATWDLDLVERNRSWDLQLLEKEEFSSLPHIDYLDDLEFGTLVVWENLDLLLAGQEAQLGVALVEHMAKSAEHISLVFHRFLDRPGKGKLDLAFNNESLVGTDPFFSQNMATQKKPTEKITIGNSIVSVTPFVLPHLSKMDRKEIGVAEFFNKRFLENQGFYIYRNRRLIAFGSWFRLQPRTELAKHARVQVDIGSDMDSLWRLNVMKSTVEVPHKLKLALKQLVPSIVRESERVITRKGSIIANPQVLSSWKFSEIGEGEFSIEIDRDNPLITSFTDSLTEPQLGIFGLLIGHLEASLPIVDISKRLLADQFSSTRETQDELLLRAKKLVQAINLTEASFEKSFELVSKMEPFATDLSIKELLLKNKEAILDELK